MSDGAAVLARGLAVVGAMLLFAGGAEAGTTYRFEDETGTVHYTNVPTDPRFQAAWTEPAPPAGPKPTVAPRGVPALGEAIRQAAERYGVDQRLIEAVIRVESGGNPGAVSPKGAQGLMQLMPQRSTELGVQNPFNVLQNLDGGVRHLRDLLQRFAGNVTLALAAYNAGEAAVRSYQGIPPFGETREYVRKVRALYDGAVALVGGAAGETTPQRIYRQVGDDGALVFTNLPPQPAVTLQQRF